MQIVETTISTLQVTTIRKYERAEGDLISFLCCNAYAMIIHKHSNKLLTDIKSWARMKGF